LANFVVRNDFNAALFENHPFCTLFKNLPLCASQPEISFATLSYLGAEA
jgi:hypothetical protein